MNAHMHARAHNKTYFVRVAIARMAIGEHVRILKINMQIII